MEFEIFNLQNEIRVIHQYRDSPAAHFGVFINVGSRDEPKHGLAHLVEHCLFKGTKKRKAFHILNRIEIVGGEINAYTSKEETCIYSSFLPKYYERAIELIADIIFNSVFNEKEIAKEKDIILDEINLYKDNPSEQIFDNFETLIFKNHPLENGILGTKKSLANIEQNDLINFKNKYYSPQNIVLSSTGNISIKQLRKYIEKHFSEPKQNQLKLKKRYSPTNYSPIQEKITKNGHQSHLILGNRAYSIQEEKKRKGLILLNHLLGGGSMNSRLNLNISEKYGFAYQIESNFNSYCDTGLFYVYIGTDSKSLQKAERLIYKELDKLCKKPLTHHQLNSAKEQIKGQIAIQQESGCNSMLSLGKSLLTFKKVYNLKEIYQLFDMINSEELQAIANEIFIPEKMSSLCYLSKNKL